MVLIPDIRAARQALGLSLQGLADLLGLADRQSVRHWEAGRRNPSGPVLMALALLIEKRGLDPTRYGLTAPP